MEPRIVADYASPLGEGPIWHPMERRLYWLDIEGARMYRLDPATGSHEQVLEGHVIGGCTVQQDGSLLLMMENGAVAIWREGSDLEYVFDELPDQGGMRFNECIADPAGRVFSGTMLQDSERAAAGERPGTLYRFDTDGSVNVALEDIRIPNGMGFSLDNRKMYYTDSMDYGVSVFDYDVESGGISNQRAFVRMPEGGEVPDGMAMDSEGHVWSARWDGSALYRYTPDGVEERRVPFPAKKVSSVTFGGDDLTDMFVTTAGGDNRAEEGPGAGALFQMNLGIKGRPGYLSRIGL